MGKERVLHLTKKDFIRQAFRAGGNGGQKQNKTSSGVRFIHPPSGARGESREERSQEQNERAAFRRMANSAKFRAWVAEQHATWERGRSLEQEVEALMSDENLLVEIRGPGGGWIKETPDTLC